MPEGRNRSASLRRALEVLSTVASGCERGAPFTLTELAAQTDINRSTVFRLLQPLRDVRLVDFDEATGRYSLGPSTARLGQIYLANSDVHAVAESVLRELVQETRETAHLGIRDGVDVVYVNKVESPMSVRTVSRVGSRQPLYCTAMGKVLIAYADESVVDEVVASGLDQHAPNTICDNATLSAELESVRAQGYAVDDQENEIDIRCVGAPILDHTGAVIAAISISGPSSRMTTERVPALATTVKNAAVEVSRRLAAPEASLQAAGLVV